MVGANHGHCLKAANIVRPLYLGQNPNFRVITLKEPPKKEMVPFLEREHRGQHTDPRPACVARVQVVTCSNQGLNQLIELLVDLDQAAIVKQQNLVGKHSYIDSAYIKAVERACISNKSVQAEIETLDLPAKATVCVEPWAYASDGMNDMSERITTH
jgi:primary-amine oxidase